MTMTAAELATALDHLDGDALDHLGAILRERASHRRLLLTEGQCRGDAQMAPLTPAWERSQLSDVGRVRTACRLLVEAGRHPEQIRPAMEVVALELIGQRPNGHPLIAAEAIKAGLADGMFSREAAQS